MYLISSLHHYSGLESFILCPMFVCKTLEKTKYWIKTLKTNLSLMAKELKAHPKPVYPKPSSSLSRKDCEKLQLEIYHKYEKELEEICKQYLFTKEWIYTDMHSIKLIDFVYSEIEEK